MITINLGAFMVLSRRRQFFSFSCRIVTLVAAIASSSSSGGEPPKWTSGLASGSGLFGSAMHMANAMVWPQTLLTWELHSTQYTWAIKANAHFSKAGAKAGAKAQQLFGRKWSWPCKNWKQLHFTPQGVQFGYIYSIQVCIQVFTIHNKTHTQTTKSSAYLVI